MIKRIFIILMLLCSVCGAEIVANGATSQSFYMVMFDRNGDPNTSITVTTLNLNYVTDQNTVISANCTDLGSENANFTANGCYEMGTSGLYRFDVPDAALRHGVGGRTNLWVTDDVSGTRTSFLSVLLSPAVDAVAISGDTTTADNLQTITEEMLIVYDTDWATNYDTTADMFNVDLTLIEGADASDTMLTAADIENAFFADPNWTTMVAYIDTEVDSILTQANEADVNNATIIADVTGINGDAMRGTDSASTHAAADIWSDASGVLVLADTNELQTDWANGGRLDTILDTAAAAGATAEEVWEDPNAFSLDVTPSKAATRNTIEWIMAWLNAWINSKR